MSCAGIARAQFAPAYHRPPPKYSVRGTFGAGTMVSNDQISALGYDRVSLLASVHVLRMFRPWFEMRTGMHGGLFYATNDTKGGLTALTIGPSFSLPARSLRPWAAVDVGAGVTDDLVRPFFQVTLGVDGRVDERVSIGPAASYGQLVQWNRPSYSTDAKYFWLGVSLRVRFDAPPPPPPPKPRTRVVRVVERVVEPAPPPEPGEDVLMLIERALPTQKQRIELLAPVLFALDSDELEPIGIAMLHEVSRTLATRPDIKLLQIEGYADKRGDVEYNRALSERRAERVRGWLIEHGVVPERLRVAPRGESELVEAGEDEGAHTQNRRVIFRVIDEQAP